MSENIKVLIRDYYVGWVPVVFVNERAIDIDIQPVCRNVILMKRNVQSAFINCVGGSSICTNVSANPQKPVCCCAQPAKSCVAFLQRTCLLVRSSAARLDCINTRLGVHIPSSSNVIYFAC